MKSDRFLDRHGKRREPDRFVMAAVLVFVLPRALRDL